MIARCVASQTWSSTHRAAETSLIQGGFLVFLVFLSFLAFLAFLPFLAFIVFLESIVILVFLVFKAVLVVPPCPACFAFSAIVSQKEPVITTDNQVSSSHRVFLPPIGALFAPLAY